MRILFFGALRDLAGRASETIDLPSGATVADVLRHYERAIALPKAVLTSLATSVNQQYALASAKLNENDEVALLPPVSGGSESSPKPVQSYAAMVRQPVNTSKIINEIKAPEDGAVVVFEGIVRNHSRGRRTLYLEYQAYEGMALKQMNALAEQAREDFAIREVALIHRLGRIEIGETSVLIVVAAAHRAAAFDACRWLIDTLKRTVPIWKKEYFADGAVWAGGEPFPADIAHGSGTPAPGRASK